MAQRGKEAAEKEERPGEAAIRALYEWKPYPALGDKPKDTARWVRPIQHLLPSGELRYLDAGCGTGHSIVGMAKTFPNWHYHAIDISGPSLQIAQQLAQKHGVKIEFQKGNYLDPLPFSGPFDLIACFGSIVVCENPIQAVRNLIGYLADDGILMLWLYSKVGHEPRLRTKEILSIFEPDVFNHAHRFKLYRELRGKRKRGPVSFLLDLSMRSLLRSVRDRMRSAYYRKQSFDYNYTEPDQLWADNFCLPFEHHYNVRDVEALAKAAGLEVLVLTAQGHEDPRLLPNVWNETYEKLDKWSKWRLMELLDHGRPQSMEVYGRRPRRSAERPD